MRTCSTTTAFGPGTAASASCAVTAVALARRWLFCCRFFLRPSGPR